MKAVLGTGRECLPLLMTRTSLHPQLSMRRPHSQEINFVSEIFLPIMPFISYWFYCDLVGTGLKDGDKFA
jgi:hypothetical protein